MTTNEIAKIEIAKIRAEHRAKGDIEFAPLQFAATAKEALDGLLSYRGIGPYTVDRLNISDLIQRMIEDALIEDRIKKRHGSR